jgi:hypothetical protein
MEDMTNSLTPFVRHAMQNTPGSAGTPEATGSRLSPPLGKPPVPDATQAATQPEPTPLATPHPGPQAAPQAAPAPRGTAVPCHQKNAADFLAGNTLGVMAYYDPSSPEPLDPEKGQYAPKVQNAPPQAAVPTQEDEDVVRHLVEWREEATY